MKAFQEDITSESKESKRFFLRASKTHRDKLRDVLGFKNVIRPVKFKEAVGLR